ncbi:MAG TPA: sulfatase [Polyangiales bacterium]|nr:sulfatase [Polyangiales bacterium]
MAPAELPTEPLASIDPAAAHVTGTPQATPRAHSSLPALRFALRANALVWLGDVLWFWREQPAYPLPAAQGMFAALFLGMLVFGALGAIVEGARGLGRLGGGGSLRARVRAWLFDGSPEQHRERAASLLALPVVLGVYALGTFLVSQRIILGMARPEFAALAVVGSQLVLLMAAAVVFYPARGLGMLCARGLSRVSLLRRAWQVLSLLVLLALLALGLFVLRYREPLGYLPWREIVQIGLAFTLAGVLGLVPRLPRMLTLPLTAAAAGCAALGVLATFSLASATGYARRVAEHSSLSGGLGYRALRTLFDRDHDGYMSILGDGDCAAKDPTRNPGATDIPGNQIDEDCDGYDLDPSTLAPRGKLDFALPETLPKRPPIILLTIDAFAADRMGKLGGKRGITPNIDAFAARSAFFSSCYAQGPSTRLSFPSLFTSRWDSQIRQTLIGKHPFPIDPSETMLADVLRGAGYSTVAVLGDGYFAAKRWNGITRGFSRVDSSAIDVDPKPTHNGPNVTEAVIAELKRQRDAPLFLWAHYYDAHSPHVQPKDMPVFGKSRADVYDAELMLVDREVGRVLKAIDEAFHGQALVILTADHGIAFDPPRHEKFNYGYDLSSAVLHVPLIFHGDFVLPRQWGGVVSTMDIMPTLLNLLRLPSPAQLEGESLVPELLRGERARPPELMHQMFLEERLWKFEEPLERVSLRTQRFNLLWDRVGGFYELYDYKNDYFETHDLSLNPAYEGTLRDLKRQLALLVYVARRPEADAKPEPHASEKHEP